MEEEAMPFPNEESTPPVMKMYLDVFGTQHLRKIREDWTGSKLRTVHGIRHSNSHVLRTLVVSMHTTFCIILLAIGLVVTSCHQYFSSGDIQAQRLRIWYLHGTPELLEFVAVASAELQASGLDVSWKPCTALELQSLAESTNDTLRPDILLLPSSYAEMVTRLGMARNPVPPLDHDIPQATELCRFQGGFVGYPLFCDMRQVLINTNVMRVVAEPVEYRTWPPENECIGAQILVSTIASESLQPVTPWGTIFDNSTTMAEVVTSWMSWFGATVVDSLQQPALLSQQSNNALQIFSELSREGIIDTERQLQAMFLRGQLGMYVGQSSVIRRINPGSNISLSMMPVCGSAENQRVPAQLTVTMATVTKHCRDTALAYQVLKSLKTFTKEKFKGGFPTTVSYWESARSGHDASMRTLAKRVAGSTPFPALRSWSQIVEVISQSYMRVILGQSEIQASLERAQGELREVLAQ